MKWQPRKKVGGEAAPPGGAPRRSRPRDRRRPCPSPAGRSLPAGCRRPAPPRGRSLGPARPAPAERPARAVPSRGCSRGAAPGSGRATARGAPREGPARTERRRGCGRPGGRGCSLRAAPQRHGRAAAPAARCVAGRFFYRAWQRFLLTFFSGKISQAECAALLLSSDPLLPAAVGCCTFSGVVFRWFVCLLGKTCSNQQGSFFLCSTVPDTVFYIREGIEITCEMHESTSCFEHWTPQ